MSAMTPAGKPDPFAFTFGLGTVVAMIVGSVGPWGYSSDPPLKLNGIDRDGKVTLSLALGAAADPWLTTW
jgi:hypothetical protein